jgi:tRNA(Ile)-lysidine synthase
MVLLHAAARVARRAVVCVATFDHGTGPAARRAVGRVASVAGRLRLPVVIGHAPVGAQASEAVWRDQRHRFLREVAERVDAEIATAHTRDDQVETVLMRILRDTGPRGLAALYAPRTGFVRPLMDLSRDTVAAYASAARLSVVDDPANASMRFLRNRVRCDLLPALATADPGFESALLDIARRAAAWRVRVDAIAAQVSHPDGSGGMLVDAAALAALDRDALAILWPAIAARAGVAMDWRGTERAAEFTSSARLGSRIPLSGGWEIARARDEFELRPVASVRPVSVRALRPGTQVDGWRFVATRGPGPVSNLWVAQLPRDSALFVRSWHPGDRMRFDGGLRKVKRFLTDARISGTRRNQWPVVLAGDEIVWIPGVRRGDTAALPVRPGRPGVWYRCEFDDR